MGKAVKATEQGGKDRKCSMTKKQSGISGELKAAHALTLNGFRLYLPYHGNNKDDDFAAVNEHTGNVYRIQVKAKQDKAKWSGVLFGDIQEKCHTSLIYILVEHSKIMGEEDLIFIVPSKYLAEIKADENGFDHYELKNDKYRNNWSLLK